MTRRVERLFPARTLFERYDDKEIRHMADHAGVAMTTIRHWIQSDVHFSVWKADIVACRFGKHPTQVWGEKWLEA